LEYGTAGAIAFSSATIYSGPRTFRSLSLEETPPSDTQKLAGTLEALWGR